MFKGAKGKNGFTIVELIVVVAMIMLLAGALGTAVSAASRRARIAQATADVQEITNALLASEKYTSNGKPLLDGVQGDNMELTEAAFGFLFGKVDGVPVLYNASIRGGKVLDPWGNPYRVIVEKKTVSGSSEQVSGSKTMYLAYPNIGRPVDDETVTR